MSSPSTARPVRAVLWGIGELGRIAGHYLLEKGVVLVGGVARSDAQIGKDLGDLIGVPQPLGVTVMAPGDPTLGSLAADIVVIGAHNNLAPMFSAYETCIRAGMNVIDMGGEVSWAWATEPQLAARLDSLARAHGVTVTGGGNQELTMGGGTLIASACHSLNGIWHKTRADIERYGRAVLEYCHVGQPASQFLEASPNVGGVDTFMCNQAADLGLTIATVTREVRPAVSTEACWSSVLNRALEPGETLGTYRTVTVETHQGIRLVGEEDVSILQGDGDIEYKEWVIDGDPPIRLRCDLDTKRSVPASTVNRIPDVIAAAPGYRPINTLTRNRYRAYPFVIDD